MVAWPLRLGIHSVQDRRRIHTLEEVASLLVRRRNVLAETLDLEEASYQLELVVEGNLWDPQVLLQPLDSSKHAEVRRQPVLVQPLPVVVPTAAEVRWHGSAWQRDLPEEVEVISMEQHLQLAATMAQMTAKTA